MTEVCTKLTAFQPQNRKHCIKVKSEENAVVLELRQKMHKLKFRLLDLQNQNQMLRKELLRVNKLLGSELASCGPRGDRKQVKAAGFTGHQNNVLSLQHRILGLQQRIRELETGESSSSSQCEEPKKKRNVSFSDEKNWTTASETERESTPETSGKQGEAVAGGVVIRGKLDYFKNRNKDLKQEVALLRLELNRLAEKNDESMEIHKTYMTVDGELRDRQSETVDFRNKLDAAKTRNQQLAEERSMVQEDIHKMVIKASDDEMLLEALTSQQGNFHDLMERQKMLCESDNRRFREDLREVQTKHTTNVHLMNQLQEFSNESGSMLQQLQHPTPLAVYVTEEPQEAVTGTTTTLSSGVTEQTTATDVNTAAAPADNAGATEQQPQPPDEELEKLKDEKKTAMEIFESAQDEVEHLAEIAVSNNSKLNEWRGQLLHSRAVYYQKVAEVHELESRRFPENNSTEKNKAGAEKENGKNLVEELQIKKELGEEEHRFLADLWHEIASGTIIVFQIYTTSADRTKKLFLDALKKMKEKLEEEKVVPEDPVEAQPPAAAEGQSS